MWTSLRSLQSNKNKVEPWLLVVFVIPRNKVVGVHWSSEVKALQIVGSKLRQMLPLLLSFDARCNDFTAKLSSH